MAEKEKDLEIEKKLEEIISISKSMESIMRESMSKDKSIPYRGWKNGGEFIRYYDGREGSIKALYTDGNGDRYEIEIKINRTK